MDAVLLMQSDVEPYRAVEGAILMQTKPGEFIVEAFAIFVGGEIMLLGAPIGNGARDAMNELPE